MFTPIKEVVIFLPNSKPIKYLYAKRLFVGLEFGLFNIKLWRMSKENRTFSKSTYVIEKLKKANHSSNVTEMIDP